MVGWLVGLIGWLFACLFIVVVVLCTVYFIYPLLGHYTTYECAVHGFGDAANLKKVRRDIESKYKVICVTIIINVYIMILLLRYYVIDIANKTTVEDQTRWT